jgi:hypothetical protein
MNQSCQCPCGSNQFSTHGDVVLFKLGNVTVPDQAVTFGKYKGVAAIDRGICDHCHKPVMAKMGKDDKGYAFIAAQNFANPHALPDGAMHVFYGTRKEDADDTLPKHKSWFSSQLAFLKLLRTAG